MRFTVRTLDIAVDQSWLSWAGKKLMPRLYKIDNEEKEATMQEEATEAGRAADATKEEAAKLAQEQHDEA